MYVPLMYAVRLKYSTAASSRSLCTIWTRMSKNLHMELAGMKDVFTAKAFPEMINARQVHLQISSIAGTSLLIPSCTSLT